MKASELAKELNHLISEEGDLEITISCTANSPELQKIATDQKYLVSEPSFVVVDKYDDRPSEISIRDWPY